MSDPVAVAMARAQLAVNHRARRSPTSFILRAIAALLSALLCAGAAVFIIAPLFVCALLWKRRTLGNLRARYGSVGMDGDPHAGVVMAHARDSIWLQDEPNNICAIHVILQLHRPPDLSRFRDTLNERIVTARDRQGRLIGDKLTRYSATVDGVGVWHRHAFCIDDHIYEYGGPTPRDRVELQRVIGELVSEQFPERRPPWQVIIIRGYRQTDQSSAADNSTSSSDQTTTRQTDQSGAADQRTSSPDQSTNRQTDQSGAADQRTSLPDQSVECADEAPSSLILLRLHHSLADGISLLRLVLGKLVDDVSAAPAARHVNSFSGRRVILGAALKSLLHGPLMIVERLFWRADRHALHGPEPSGDKRVAWSRQISLDFIKRVKNAAGCTVNDVVVACVTGALRAYLCRHSSRVPDNLLCYVPIDLRNPDDDIILDNQFVLVYLRLPVGVEDELERLVETRRRMNAIKESPEPFLNTWLIEVAMRVLPSWASRALFDSVAAKCTMVLSNVPGPAKSLHVDSLEIEEALFLPALRRNMLLGMSILSYNGYVRLGAFSDKAILTDPAILGELFVEQVYLLAKRLKIE